MDYNFFVYDYKITKKNNNYGSNRYKNGDNYCSSDCKPYLYSGSCYDCSETFGKSGLYLYVIGSDGKCRYPQSLSNQKIISETNEVVNSTYGL